MQKLPSFSEFLDSIDPDKADYDMRHYGSYTIDDRSGAFTQKQYELIVRTSLALARGMLAEYHQWLNEKLSASELQD